MHAKKGVLLALLPALLSVGLWAEDVPETLAAGIERFQDGQYSQAVATFRAIIADPSLRSFHGHAYYWVARTRMAEDRLDAAADAYDYFLNVYDDHLYSLQAAYDRARLFYLAEDYESTIQAFSAFVDANEESDLVANALYWTGESLFELGQIASARRYFLEVVEGYPSSYRVEAARYRIDVIDLKQREDELLQLLRWSHEEYLGALEEFQDRERAYEEALRTYRNRLANLAAADFQAEIETLSEQVQDLSEQLAERDRRISELLGQMRRLESEQSSAPSSTSAAEEEVAAQTTPSSGSRSAAGSSQPPGDNELREELLALKLEALQLMQAMVAEGGQR